MKTTVTTFERTPESMERGEYPTRMNPQPLPDVPHPFGSDESRKACKAALEKQGYKVCSMSSTNGTAAARDGEPIPEGLVVHVELPTRRPGRRAR
jgi:hypothetical protein